MKNANEALIDYIMTLTEEQAAKLVAHLDLLKQFAGMSEHKQVYIETLVEKIFGKAGA